MYRWISVAFFWAVLFACFAPAQTITGSISGTVRDSTGQSVPDAEVTVINQATGGRFATKSDLQGLFVLSGLLPGSYTLSISKPGFKGFEQKDTVLTASERRSVGDILLELGAITERITVTAVGSAVQTVSAERSSVITTSQVMELMMIGRDYTDLLRTLPGVADFGSHESPSGSLNMAVQGNRPGTNNLTIDGANNLNAGSPTGTWLVPSVDSIAEVKVLLNNYQAEYGRNSGGSVSVITKSGAREFHGSGYYFKRNEAFNANNYFFNQRGVRRPLYRYDFGGFNLGGPIYIPRRFNTGRDKLFFFFSQELLPQRFPQAQNLRTVPTAIERQGDFSKTLDQNGRLVVIRDPDSGQQFPGNVIPPSLINPNTQKLLSVFPLPNYADPSGAFNYITGGIYSQPRYESLFRVDYRISDSHSLYFRGILDSQEQKGWGVPGGGGDWPFLPSTYTLTGRGWLLSVQNTLSPTLVHQFTAGLTRAIEQVAPQPGALERVSRSGLGISLPQFYPKVNDLDLVPLATYGGVPNAASINLDGRYPFFGANNIWNFTDNLTKVRGPHTVKVGVYIERVQRAAKRASTFNSSFDFSRDVNNPLDSGWAYANALLGVYRSYSDSDNRPWGNIRYSHFEWYLQDTWKASRKLTLDYGMRFNIVQPQHERDGKFSGFVPDRFDFGRAAVLVRPVRNAAGQRVGQNPITGGLLPAVLIGAIAQGDPANGMVAAFQDKTGYPWALMDNRGVQYGPRIGFAFDPKGDGKMAFRGGFGISYNRESTGTFLPLCENPPMVFTPTSYYGKVEDLPSAPQFNFPTAPSGVARSGEVPSVMSYSLGIQRELWRGVISEIAYVGTLSRHMLQSVNLNGISPGANFLAQNQDPTLPGTPLPLNFLRPFPGLGNINFLTYDASSNYHSMQVQAHRRFVKPLQISGVWTWSKTMSTSDGGQVSRYLNQKARYYGRAGVDRTHIVNINWIYDLPRVSAFWKTGFARRLLDSWQFTGIASFMSGAPLGIGLTTTDGADITGSATESARTDLIAKPELPKGQRTPGRYFNTEAFARPARGTLGNAAKDLVRGPGINNWDMGLSKNVYFSERARFQFRLETYNAFNHTQFSGLDTTARFDPQGRQVNGLFSQATSARSPRRLQLAVKLFF